MSLMKSFSNSLLKILEVTRSREGHLTILNIFYKRVEVMLRGNLEGYHTGASVSVVDMIKYWITDYSWILVQTMLDYHKDSNAKNVHLLLWYLLLFYYVLIFSMHLFSLYFSFYIQVHVLVCYALSWFRGIWRIATTYYYLTTTKWVFNTLYITIKSMYIFWPTYLA